MSFKYETDKELRVEEMSEVKVEKERVDGKKSREYYTLLFSDAANPLIHWRARNFFQQHSPDGKEVYWRGANPASAKSMVKAVIKGEIMKVPVETYTIVDGTGVARDVDNFTIVIFDGESLEEVVKSYGHLLAQNVSGVGSARTDVGRMPATKEQLEQSRINSQNVRITDAPNSRSGEGYSNPEAENDQDDIFKDRNKPDAKEKKDNAK